MKLHKKIPSFTLSEMLVVILISSIVISLAISVLNLVQKEIHTLQSVYQQKTALNTLKQVLWKDLSFHHNYYDIAKKELISISNTDTVFYQFDKSKVIRNRDTIFVSIDSITPFLENNLTNGYIDAI